MSLDHIQVWEFILCFFNIYVDDASKLNLDNKQNKHIVSLYRNLSSTELYGTCPVRKQQPFRIETVLLELQELPPFETAIIIRGRPSVLRAVLKRAILI